MKKILLLVAALSAFVTANAQNPCTASFTYYQNTGAPQFQVSIFNTSSPAPSGYTASGYLDFGDGSNQVMLAPNSGTAHYYNNFGTYNVKLTNTIKDVATQQVVCTDTVTTAINVAQYPFNRLLGVIHPYPGSQNSISHYKVWLIQHDSSANTLTAVDSIEMNPGEMEYIFESTIPGNNYFVKVKPVYSGIPPAYGYVPTYSDSSIYWNGATEIIHTGNPSWADIWLQTGTPTTGPGFVGGNISQGAGKGTGTGIPDMLVFLRNNDNNKMIASTYTDANGDYSFSNIPAGSYNVYPEEMNYTTTPSTALNITTGQTNSTGIDFVQTDDEIKPATELGIPSVSKNDGISIYPNPVSDQLFIENKTDRFNQFSIVNTIGQVVKQGSLKQGNNKVETLTLGSGIYYIIVNGADGSRSMKLTKK
jgi:hypothetical protein